MPVTGLEAYRSVPALSRAIDWTAQGPAFTELLRRENAVAPETWRRAQDVLLESRARYLVVEAPNTWIEPFGDGGIVHASAFRAEREQLSIDLGRSLEQVLGRPLDPELLDKLTRELFPLGEAPTSLALHGSGPLRSVSKNLPHLDEQGERVLYRFGHLAASLQSLPPDAATAALKLTEDLARLAPQDRGMSFTAVRSESTWGRLGRFVDLNVSFTLRPGVEDPLELMRRMIQGLEESRWSVRSKLEELHIEREPDSGASLGSVRFKGLHLIYLPAAPADSSLANLPTAERVQTEKVALSASIRSASMNVELVQYASGPNAFLPGAFRVRAKHPRFGDESLEHAAARVAQLATDAGWSTTVFVWSEKSAGTWFFDLKRLYR